MLKIKDMPCFERPYEKLEKYGEKSLSDAELLAIIIKNGVHGETSVSLAQRLIKENADEKGLVFLKRMDIKQLTAIKGIGRVKAIQLKAVFELANRINEAHEKRIKIMTPIDVCKLLMNDLRNELTEQVIVITTDIKGYLIKKEVVAIGKNNSVHVDAKIVFKTAISYSSANVIIVHNHPSGDPIPSPEDIAYTKKLEKIAEELDVTLVDHIIIGNNQYVSLRNDGFLQKY